VDAHNVQLSSVISSETEESENPDPEEWLQKA
jgi:hypothetical protein